MSSPIIKVENLCKDYTISHQGSAASYQTLRESVTGWFKNQSASGGSENFHALKDVSFEVQQGEVLGIIGRNGAGKSTLLKILSRITEPTAGKITIRGRVASLLEVGTGFHPELTGRENIFLNGAILGMTRAEIKKKFDEIVDFSGVEKFLDTPVKRYSSGMYVRLAFAVAAHLEPEILIVDEVLAVGDQEFQKKCLGKMKDVSASEGRTVLFVSHNFAAVAQLCNRAILLAQGQVQQIGSVPDVLQTLLASQNSNLRPGNSDLLRTPRITEITLDADALETGDLIVSIKFEAPTPLAQPHIGLVITTQFGVPVLGTNTNIDPLTNSHPAATGTLRLRLLKPHLLAGHYRINLWFGDGDGSLQFIEGAADFHFPGIRPRPLDFRIDTVGPLDSPATWEQLTLNP